MVSKIVCIGDSITKGKVWKENEKRPYITEKSYPTILKELSNIEVLNGGVCDITSEEMLNIIKRDMRFEKGSAVIVEIGGNDCNLNWRNIRKNPDGEHCPAVSLEKFRGNLFSIIEIIKSHGALPILSTLPPLDGDRYYNLLKRVFGEGIKRWIDRNGGIYRWQERYSTVIKDIADVSGTYLVDIRKAFLDSLDYKRFLSYDGIHPTEQGYSLIAAALFMGIKDILI